MGTYGFIQLRIGFSIFNERLKGNIDIYKANTKDLLIERTLPELIGFSSVMSNLGEVENKGIELSLTSRILIQRILHGVQHSILL